MVGAEYNLRVLTTHFWTATKATNPNCGHQRKSCHHKSDQGKVIWGEGGFVATVQYIWEREWYNSTQRLSVTTKHLWSFHIKASKWGKCWLECFAAVFVTLKILNAKETIRGSLWIVDYKIRRNVKSIAIKSISFWWILIYMIATPPLLPMLLIAMSFAALKIHI